MGNVWKTEKKGPILFIKKKKMNLINPVSFNNLSPWQSFHLRGRKASHEIWSREFRLASSKHINFVLFYYKKNK